eukprot:scaffold158828_cov32-Tisochrysis_lutea.AAC.10
MIVLARSLFACFFFSKHDASRIMADNRRRPYMLSFSAAPILSMSLGMIMHPPYPSLLCCINHHCCPSIDLGDRDVHDESRHKELAI